MQKTEEQIGHTIGLGCLHPGSGNGIVVAEVAGTSGFSFHIEIDYQFPLHTAAPGKAMMAHLPEQDRAAYYENMDFKQYTPSTITSRAEYERELNSVIEQGYSIDVSEMLEGCHCVGVPIFDENHRVVAALWTTGPSSQLPVRRFEPIAKILRKSAQEISTRISGSTRSANRDYINAVIKQAQEVIRNNLHQPLDPEALAANMHVGYSWFRKIFKQQTGMAPIRYHQTLRLDRAKDLLTQSKMTVRQISETMGFRTQNHFSALFKKVEGQSPSEWRLEHKA